VEGMESIKGPGTLQLSIRLNCLCNPGSESMQIVDAVAGGGSFANAASASVFECPTCRRKVVVDLLVETRYDRPIA